MPASEWTRLFAKIGQQADCLRDRCRTMVGEGTGYHRLPPRYLCRRGYFSWPDGLAPPAPIIHFLASRPVTDRHRRTQCTRGIDGREPNTMGCLSSALSPQNWTFMH